MIGIGIAKVEHLEEFFGRSVKVSEVLAENPALEAILDGLLVGRCELNISADMLSEMDILEDGEVDELHYAVEFKDIRVLPAYHRRGIGRRLTACAARHAASTIVENLQLRKVKAATISFHATLVSDAGEKMFEELVESVMCQFEYFDDIFEINFENEGGR